MTSSARYQIIQKELGILLVKVVKDRGYSDDDEQKIISRLEQIVGGDIKIKIGHVSHIPSSPRSGNFLPIISEIASSETE